MILEYFKNMDTTNPKKIKKLALKLYNDSTFDMQKKLCMDIIESKDPLKTVNLFINRIEDFAILMKQFIEDGCHGMLFTGDKGEIVFPVKLDTNEKWLSGKLGNWIEEDEYEIQLDVANKFKKSTNRKKVLVKVVLFPQFGFSGIPRIFEV